MKKIALITLNGNYNFGNKLQHYALQKVLEGYSFDVETIPWYFDNNILIRKTKDFIKSIISKRFRKFKKFDKKIYYSKYKLCNSYISKKIDNDYSFFVVGSDQVWNSNFGLNYKLYLLDFTDNNKKISYSASFGTNNVLKEKEEYYKKCLSNFKSISVREDSGKKIIENLTGRTDAEVLVDPTMLLTADEWEKESIKPKKYNILEGKKYILNYFLGNLSDSRKRQIEKVAKDNNCKIINLLDKNDPFYCSGPSEFLWLEKNAYLVCTDSFHSCVFALLFNRPFVVFDREQSGLVNMNSRLDTLISKFKLKNRRYNGNEITKDNINHDYSDAYKILEKEREKSDAFLKRALDN